MRDTGLQRLQAPASSLDIEVFRLDLELGSEISGVDWDVLNPLERQQAGRYLRPDDALRFARTRAVLRRLLQDRVGVPARDIRFDRTSHGKPYLHPGHGTAGGAWQFNISHSGGYALLALSRRHRVGVDIEARRTLANQVDLKNMVFSDAEREGSSEPDFYVCWTAKEAILKATGQGIGQHLRALTVAPEGTGPSPFFAIQSSAFDCSKLAACSIEAAPGYAAALAWIKE